VIHGARLRSCGSRCARKFFLAHTYMYAYKHTHMCVCACVRHVCMCVCTRLSSRVLCVCVCVATTPACCMQAREASSHWQQIQQFRLKLAPGQESAQLPNLNLASSIDLSRSAASRHADKGRGSESRDSDVGGNGALIAPDVPVQVLGHVRVCVCLCMHVCMHVCMYVYVHINIAS
jgi:hypothetical protein